MFCTIHSATLTGISCAPVAVEVDISKGWPGFNIVGLGDTAVQEARERIKAAWKNTNLSFPHNFKILINLAPAHTRKIGTLLDLPMALGMYLASARLQIDTAKSLFIGELALDGTLRYVDGILSIILFAKEAGFENVFVPLHNAKEAMLADGIRVFAVTSLKQVIDHVTNVQPLDPLPKEESSPSHILHTEYVDMKHIKGQQYVKRGLEIAASGGHNILLNGPPGSGKTLLARALAGILPPMSKQEALEVTKLYSASGLLRNKQHLLHTRPFRSPHHSTTITALVGGGNLPQPGEISLAHRGVLFLDEFLEFPRSVLEHLRQPLEEGEITIARANASVSFPARFILVASQNPCPCGFAGDPESECSCSSAIITRYRKKLSGPLLDRIDLLVEVPRVCVEKLTSKDAPESSASIQKRVEAARSAQARRFEKTKYITNSEISQKDIEVYCELNSTSRKLLEQAVNQLKLSARSYFRILKVSRTIADLELSEKIKTEHVAEALQYRHRID